MNDSKYKPKHLYIYTEFPDPAIVPLRNLCTSYKATAAAIARGDEEVHTLQLAFFNHQFIRANYIIHLRDGIYEYIFDREWLDSIISPGQQLSPYYLLENYKWDMIRGYDQDDYEW